MNIEIKTESLDWACAYAGSLISTEHCFRFDSTNPAVLYWNERTDWDGGDPNIIITPPSAEEFEEYDKLGEEKLTFELREIYKMVVSNIKGFKQRYDQIASLHLFKELKDAIAPRLYYPRLGKSEVEASDYNCAILTSNPRAIGVAEAFYEGFGKTASIVDLSDKDELSIIKYVSGMVDSPRMVIVEAWHPILCVLHSWYVQAGGYLEIPKTIQVLNLVPEGGLPERRDLHIWGGVVPVLFDETLEITKQRGMDWAIRYKYNFDSAEWFRATAASRAESNG